MLERTTKHASEMNTDKDQTCQPCYLAISGSQTTWIAWPYTGAFLPVKEIQTIYLNFYVEGSQKHRTNRKK